MKKIIYLVCLFMLIFLASCKKDAIYEVSFETNGGTPIETITSLEDLTAGIPSTTKEYFEFDGWFFDEALTLSFDLEEIEETTFTLYAKWIPALVDYHIEIYQEDFDEEFELIDTETKTSRIGSIISIDPEVIPGFTFDVDHEDNLLNATILAETPITFSLYYTRNAYTITFDSNASLSIKSIDAKFGETITEPATPIRTGYTFMGWFTDVNLTNSYQFTTMPSSSFTLYAKWMGEITSLYFNTTGGNLIDPLSAPLGSEITPPTPPTRENYDFIGWYLDSNYQNEFTSWVMPSGGITLYAKWNEKSYTLTYETDGGTVIPSSINQYNHPILEPSNPTKDEFVFGGWFTDDTYQTPFTFSSMPNHDLTIYAKWLNQEDTSTISYQTSLPIYSEVTITGTVYAILDAPYSGYMILDDTGSVLVYDETPSNLGDHITIVGTLYIQNNMHTIINIESLVLHQNDLLLINVLEETIAEITQTEYTKALFGKVYVSDALFIYENSKYYLMDLVTYEKIEVIDYYNASNFASIINHKLHATFMIMNHQGHHQVGLLNYTATPYTETEIIDDTKDYLNTLYNQTYFSYETLTFPTTDPTGLATIDYTIALGHDAYYDFDTEKLSSTTSPQTVTFYANITINDTSSSLQIDIDVNPITTISVEDFKELADGSTGAIKGIVSFKSDTNYLYGIYDGFDLIYMHADYYLEVGDEVIVMADKESYFQMPVISHESIRILHVLSRENPITYPVTAMDDPTFNALDTEDSSIYGQKVILKGFLHEMMDGHGYLLELDDKTITLDTISYTAYEDLFEFLGLEIEIKGYIALTHGDSLGLYVEGIREDYQLPDYTATERVDMILYQFGLTYGNKEFTTFETFRLYPYHPVLGGTITYEFIEGGEFYDEDLESFKFVSTPTPIKIELTISKDDITKTYIYQTTLNPLEVTSVEDLETFDPYDEVTVKGIVIYRNPELAFLKDDTGIVLIDIYDLNCYEGDEVIINGYIQFNYYDYGMISIRRIEREDSVIGILSRDNDYTYPVLEGFSALDLLDPMEPSSFNQHITLTGTLVNISYDYYITNGSKIIYIESADDYTMYKLDEMVGLNVSLTGVLIDYQDDFIIFFTGMEGDLVVNEFSDQDKLNYLSDWLISTTSDSVTGGSVIALPTTHELLNATFTYVMDESYNTIYNITTGLTSVVTEQTVIPITATIHLSETVTQEQAITLTIEPVQTIEQVLISEFLTREPNTYKLQAKIISVTRYLNGFAFLIQDESGKIFVPLKPDAYYYNSTMVGRTITVTGELELNHGRPEVKNADYTISVYSTSVETEFIETSIPEVSQFDLYDESNYGKPLLLRGKVVQLTYNTFAITDGNHVIQLHSVYQSIENLSRYTDLEAVFKVFYIGDINDDGRYDVLINNAFYGGTSTMNYKAYTDEEFAQIITSDLLETIDFRSYNAYERLYLNNYHSFFPSALISYTLTSNPLGAIVTSSELLFLAVPEDQVVTVDLTVTVNATVVTTPLSFDLKKVDIKTLSDLFLVNPELDEMGLVGQVLYSTWKFTYLLIEDKVYYIEGYFGGNFNFGDEILITGKKSTVDGITNYTYDIQILISDIEGSIEVPPVYKTFEEITLNHMNSDMQDLIIETSGILRYDKYLDMYYLEPTDLSGTSRIYLRADIEDYENYSVLAFYESISKEFMNDHLNLPITLNVLNPGKKLLDEYPLVDLVPRIANIWLVEMTPLEKINYGKDYLERLTPIDLYIYSRLFNELPFYHQVLNLSFDYELEDPLDEIYLDLSNGGMIKPVTSITTVGIIVTISYYDEFAEINYQDTYTIEVTIHPTPTSTIHEALWGKIDGIYQIKGTIINIFEDEFILVSDGTDTIYIDTYYVSDYFGVDLALNDTVIITAVRDFYEYGGYIPILTNILSIVEVTPEIVNTPAVVEMTLDDILNLNYLLPSTFNQRISYTGTLIKVGTYYYSYYLRFEGQNDDTYDLMLKPNMDNVAFDNLFYPYIGEEMTVTGYLGGFEYMYEPFDWFLIYESIVPES